jgi:hypothetical protein
VKSAATSEACRLAQNLARNRGWHVFPCREDNKHPCTPHGFKDASADPERIVELWHQFPGGLVGIATGELSGISVLDVDVSHDEARAWWRQYEHLLPITRTYRTRRGGLHLYFQHAPGVRNVQGEPTPGIDVRGQGGYVISWWCAGLECLDHAPPHPWPKWLSHHFWPPPPKPKAKKKSKTDKLSDDDLEAIKQRAIDRVRHASDGQKHYRLRASARLLGGIQSRAGFTDAEAVQWLTAALPDDIRSKVAAEKTAAYGLAKGREKPLEI